MNYLTGTFNSSLALSWVTKRPGPERAHPRMNTNDYWVYTKASSYLDRCSGLSIQIHYTQEWLGRGSMIRMLNEVFAHNKIAWLCVTKVIDVKSATSEQDC